jgi:hypothetical protein
MSGKTRTITLTGRRPVQIQEEEWPVVARAEGDSYNGDDYARHQQAQAGGEVDTYRLIARQHADGRALVYGVLSAAIGAWGQPAGGEDHRGGVLLPVGSDLAAALRAVGDECGLPDRIVRECIASLPAETI